MVACVWSVEMAPERTVRSIPKEVETIGQAAKRLQQEAGWTQTEAARRVGCTQSDWSKLCLDKILTPKQPLMTGIDVAFKLPPGTFARIVHEATIQRLRKEREGAIPYAMVAIGPADNPDLVRALRLLAELEDDELRELTDQIEGWRQGPPAPEQAREA